MVLIGTGLLVTAGQIPANSRMQRLAPVVVSATPVRDNAIGDFSVNKTTYTADEIKQMNVSDVGDVLTRVSSVSLMSEGVFGSRTVGQGRIKIRGHKPKVMIDGRPVSMGVFNCIVNNVLTLNGVEKIEVIRGGESVLFGTDGLGGAINIVTKRPEKYSSEINTKYGADNSDLVNLQTNNRGENYYYTANYERKSTDGHLARTELTSNDYFLKGGYYLTENLRAEFSGKYYDGEYEDPIENGEWDKDRAGLTFNLDGSWGKHSLSFQAHATNGEHKRHDFSGDTLQFHSEDRMEGFRTYHRVKSDNSQFLYGFDYRKYGGQIFEQMWVKNGEFTESEYAPFAVYKTSLGAKNKLIFGGRYNYHSLYDGEFLHKFSLRRNFTNNLTVTLATNRSFRTPSIIQTTMNKFKNNPDLEPEIATHYELSSTHRNLAGWGVSGSVFLIDGKNRLLSPGGEFNYENVDDYEHYGAELSLSRQFTSNLSVSLAYTHLDPDTDTRFQFQNKLTGNLNYKLRAWNLNASYKYINKYYAGPNETNRLPDYFLLDTRLRYRQNKHLEYYLEANNLLDEEYATQTYGNGDPLYNRGRAVFAGLAASF